MPIAAGQVTVAASPDEAYRLISDPTVMAGFAEELYRARWLGGVTEAAVGARFRGDNRNGGHRWWTVCRVTDAEPGQRFAYEVSTPFKVPISRWQFDLVPSSTGVTVIESSWLRVPRWFAPIAIRITGEPDRPRTNNANIALTLHRLKDHLETSPAA